MSQNLPEKLKKVLNINTDSPYYYLGVLAVALLIFGFSFYQAQSNISEPFKIGMARFDNIDVPESDELDLEDVEALKKLDTDGDGLSDYLELYVYGTSAYIEDTDSDGLGDRIEVVSGGNPLCGNPDGCNTDIFSGVVAGQQVGNIQFEGDEVVLRQMLLGVGFSAGDLVGLTIEEMNKLYSDVISAMPDDFDEIIKDDTLFDLSAEDIRNLLLTEGIPASELEAISDESLLELYQSVLQESKINY